MRYIGLFFVFFLCLQSTHAQYKASCNIGLEQTRMLIGDQQKMLIDVDYDKNAVLQHIDFEQLDSNSLELVRYEIRDSVDYPNFKTQTISAIVTAFTAGEYTISLPIRIRKGQLIDTIFSDSIHLTVYAPTLDSLKLAPIKDIMPENRTWIDYLTWILVAVCLVLSAIFSYWYYFVWRRRPKKTAVVTTPRISAYERAMKDLTALKSSDYIKNNDIKAYYSTLSNIVRLYLEQQYKVSALESTTAEILVHQRIKTLENKPQQLLSKVLNMSDFVKFATFKPADSLHDELWQDAKTFVEATKGK